MWNAGFEGPEDSRQSVRLLVGGAGRGARLMQPFIRDFNERSESASIVPVYVDPAPGKAKQLARSATDSGVLADSKESRIEEVLRADDAGTPVSTTLLSVDSPAAVASALDAVEQNPRGALVYQLVRTPRGDLLGLRLVLRTDESVLRRLATRFFRALSGVTRRSGAEAILGERGFPEHQAAESAYRRWFAAHMATNLPRLARGIEPETEPFQVTFDGREALSLQLVDHQERGWSDPHALALETVGAPTSPIARGEELVIGEIGPDGVRLHRARWRKWDGRISLRGGAALDPEGIAAAEAEELERRRAEAGAALQRALREALTRSQPVYTTD